MRRKASGRWHSVCRAGAPANSREGLSIFGSAAERAETVTADRNLSAKRDAADRQRSISGWLKS